MAQRVDMASQLGLANIHARNLHNTNEASCSNAPPIGLKLTKSHSFLKKLEKKLNEAEKKKTKKPKPDHFEITFLKIGSFEITAEREGHLVAKCYFAKRKLVWEILDKELKQKIEISMHSIMRMKPTIQHGKAGILEIELDEVPKFFREVPPEAKKHTKWDPSEDFTEGQGSVYRRHFLQFAPGVLKQHYLKLIQFDNRLLQLSQLPYPSLQSPYFGSQLPNEAAPCFGSQSIYRSPTYVPFSHYQDGLISANPTIQQEEAQPDVSFCHDHQIQQQQLMMAQPQVQQQYYGSTMMPPSSLIANNNYPISSTQGIICAPPIEAIINNQSVEDPGPNFLSGGFDDLEMMLASAGLVDGPGWSWTPEEVNVVSKMFLEESDPVKTELLAKLLREISHLPPSNENSNIDNVPETLHPPTTPK